MFTTTKYVIVIPSYKIQRDLYSTGINYAFTSFTFLEILRAQIPETNVLQVVPGYYFFLLFASFVVVFGLASLFLFFGNKLDTRKTGGRRTLNKIDIILIIKFAYFLVFTNILIGLNTLIPVTLDSIDSAKEKAIEGAWDFRKILRIETNLFFALIFLGQIPVFTLLELADEDQAIEIPLLWREITLISLILAGIITPTFDATTQASLATEGLIFFVLILTSVQKRVDLKYGSTCVLG